MTTRRRERDRENHPYSACPDGEACPRPYCRIWREAWEIAYALGFAEGLAAGLRAAAPGEAK